MGAHRFVHEIRSTASRSPTKWRTGVAAVAFVALLGACAGCARWQAEVGSDLASACKAGPDGTVCDADSAFCRAILIEEDRGCAPGLALTCEDTSELIQADCACGDTGSWSCRAAPRGVAMQLWDRSSSEAASIDGLQDAQGLGTVAVYGEGPADVVVDGNDAPSRTVAGREVRFVAVRRCPHAPAPTVAAVFERSAQVDEVRVLFMPDETACRSVGDPPRSWVPCPIAPEGSSPHLFAKGSSLSQLAVLENVPDAFARLREVFATQAVLAVPASSLDRAQGSHPLDVASAFLQCRAGEGDYQFAWRDPLCVRRPGELVAGAPQAFVLPSDAVSASAVRLVPRVAPRCVAATDAASSTASEELELAKLPRCRGPLPAGRWRSLDVWNRPEEVPDAQVHQVQWAFLDGEAVAVPDTSLRHARGGGALSFAPPESACVDDEGRVRITWRSEATTKFAEAGCADLRARLDVGVVFRVPAGATVLGLPQVTTRAERSCRFREPVWRCSRGEACPRATGWAGGEVTPATP